MSNLLVYVGWPCGLHRGPFAWAENALACIAAPQNKQTSLLYSYPKLLLTPFLELTYDAPWLTPAESQGKRTFSTFLGS
jgi:hypothetical protein